MRILVLGDSLPFPRPPRGQPIETTWPSLLHQGIPNLEVYIRAKPRYCIFDLLDEFQFFTESLDRFSAIVIQTGIVDCTPRPYPRFVYKLIELLFNRKNQRSIERFTHQKLLWLYNKPWVSAIAYRAGFQHIISETKRLNPNCKVLLVPIVRPCKTLAEKLPEISGAAELYNRILAELPLFPGNEAASRAGESLLTEDPLAVSAEDGQHLSTYGHECLARSIVERLK